MQQKIQKNAELWSGNIWYMSILFWSVFENIQIFVSIYPLFYFCNLYYVGNFLFPFQCFLIQFSLWCFISPYYFDISLKKEFQLTQSNCKIVVKLEKVSFTYLSLVIRYNYLCVDIVKQCLLYELISGFYYLFSNK